MKQTKPIQEGLPLGKPSWKWINVVKASFAGIINRVSPPMVQRKKKVIGFDVWNTTALIRAWPVEPLLDLARAMGIPVDADPDLKKRYVDFCNSTPTNDPRTFTETIGREFNVEVTEQSVDKIKEIIKVEHSGFAWYDDVLGAFMVLKEGGFEIGLLSDTWAFTGPKLRATADDTPTNNDDCAAELAELQQLLPTTVQKLASHVVMSCEEECTKPNRRIFDKLGDLFGVTSQDVKIYVGDNVEKDVYGSANAGWIAILLDRTNSVPEKTREELRARGAYCVQDLFELVRLLRSLGHLPKRA
jgi:FMN phosphatase YigB (HAD superfamily)